MLRRDSWATASVDRKLEWSLGVWLTFLLLIGCGEATPNARNDDPSGSAGGAGGQLVSGTEVGSAAAATPSPVTLAQPTWFYRIDLAQDANGTLSARSVSAVRSGIRPMPGFGGEFWALAYTGGEVTSAVPLFFPSEVQENNLDDDGDYSHTTFTLSNRRATAFVEASGVDRVTITDSAGTDVLEITGESLPPLEAAQKVRASEPIGTERQALGFEELRTRYPSIRFVAAGEEATLPEELVIGGSLVTPNDMMTNVIDAGLSSLSPALLASVHTLAIKDWSAADPRKFELNAQTYGGSIVLNLDSLFDVDSGTGGMLRTIVHESAHCYWTLVGRTAAGDDVSAWPVQAERDASELIEQYRLMIGIEPVWTAIQQSGVERGVAGDFVGDAWDTAVPTEEAARAMGFATRRAGISAAEDFAETIATANVKPTDRNICKNFTGQAQIGPEIAIPYAKLAFVTSLGALSEADFSSCVGSTQFETRPGIEMNGVSFNQNNHAEAIELDGYPYFAVYGEGPNTYQLLIRLALPSLTTSPLGLHRLDTLTLTQVGAAGRSEVLLGNDDQRLSRGTAWGLVLITEASAGQTRGIIFGLILHNGLGGYTDYVPFGTFQIYP